MSNKDTSISEHLPIFGIVTDCIRLNVLEQPLYGAKCICEIPVMSEVIIEESTKEFYKVCLASGIEGYCSKDYITIKEDIRWTVF